MNNKQWLEDMVFDCNLKIKNIQVERQVFLAKTEEAINLLREFKDGLKGQLRSEENQTTTR